MRIKYRHMLLVLALALLLGCEERYTPDIVRMAPDQLVVDGMISNLPGPYVVKLSLTSSLDNPHYIPAPGYGVSIADDLGNTWTLYESRPGTYQTPENTQAVVGRKYKLILQSPDNRHYESDYETLRSPTPLDTVYHKLEVHSVDYFPYSVPGYRFYLSTKEAETDTNYYVYQLISTYKYQADFNIYWVYDGQLRRVYDYDTLKTCYKTDTLQRYYLINTADFSTPVVKDYPLHWVGVETRELMIRYSLMVRQFSLSEQGYDYYRRLQELNTNLGDLYSQMPYQVRGNMHNTENSDDVALGYFKVSGVSEKRIFVNKPKPPIMMLYPKCGWPEWVFLEFGSIFDYPASAWPIFGTIGPGGNALPNQWCMDCRKSGGKIEKPDFWIDE